MTERSETRRPEQITQPKLLLVEGTDDQRFFSALVAHLGVPGIQILPFQGKTKLRAYLRTLPVTPGFEQVISMGVVRDADNSTDSAFQSVQDALTAAELPSPSDQLVFTQPTPRVIVAIIPPGKPEGELEDLCLESVSTEPAMECVEQYFECLTGCPDLDPHPLAKAKVHVYLASRRRPDRRLGEAAEAGDWPWHSPAFTELTDMITSM